MEHRESQSQPVPEPAPAALPSTEYSIPPAENEPHPDRVAEFLHTLATLTPRVYMTPLLIGINVFVFILMVVSGVSAMEPAVPDLLRWGADFGPKTLNGEWWRLFTCMFIHIGGIHLLLNMWVLATAGPLVERMLGNVGFLLMYLVAGLGGSLASLFWNPMVVSAGASGAIFGIYGALLGLMLRGRGSIPPSALTQLRNSGLGFILYNLVYGAIQANIDMAAHLGGLAAGFLCGLVLSQPFTLEAVAGRRMRNLVLAGVGSLLILGTMIGVYARHSDFVNLQEELERFVTVEKKALDAYNGAIEKSQRQQISSADFADLLESEVIPEWRATRERLAALKRIPTVQQQHVAAVLNYMRLREDSWELLVQALRQGNQSKSQQAMDKQKEADAAARRISAGGGK